MNDFNGCYFYKLSEGSRENHVYISMICYVVFRGDIILLRLLTAGFLLVIQEPDGKPPYEVV